MRRLFLAVLLFVLTFIGPVFSQQRWEKTYGGAGGEGGYSVQQTQDGGYIVAGYTNSFGDSIQVYLVKTNASGDTLWTRTYGGSRTDWGNSVQQTTDGGYIVAGYTFSFGDSSQVYLVKTNASGDNLWTRTYGGSSTDRGNSVQQTQDGGYIVAGYTNSFGNWFQVYLIKTNSGGDTLWTRTYGGAHWDEGWSVQQTSDGGYIVAGETSPSGNSNDVYLIKTNSGGDTLWSRNYGGTGWDEGYSVQQTSDTGYIVAGFTNSFGNGDQVYLIKTNPSGDTLWTKTYGGTDYDWGESVRQTSDGGYIVAGVYDYSGTNPQVYLVKTNATGDTLWTRTYGGTGDDEGYSIQQTSDGGYIIGGYSKSFGDGNQVYLIKTDANGNSGVEENKEVRGQRLEVKITAIPNPFTSFSSVQGHERDRFSLYDISGRRVGTYRGDRIGADVPQGVYFIRAEGKDTKPIRVVKLR
jgi:hypothetical protein